MRCFIEYLVSNVPIELSIHQFYTFFQRYGAVTDIQQFNQHQYFVTLLQTPTTNILVAERTITIAGHVCDIEWLRDFGKRIKPDPSPAPRSICMLNDDCLRNIFEMASLKFRDLCELATVCQRFNQVVGQIVESRRRIRGQTYRIRSVKGKRLWETDALLTALGPSVKSITVDTPSDALPSIILSRCPNLDEVRYVLDHEWNKRTLARLRPLMCDVRKFVIRITAPTKLNLSQLFDCQPRVQKLVVAVHRDQPLELPHVRLPQLQELVLNEVHEVDVEALGRFLAYNSQVKRVHFDRATDRACDAIHGILPELMHAIESISWMRSSDEHRHSIQLRMGNDGPGVVPADKRPMVDDSGNRNFLRNPFTGDRAVRSQPDEYFLVRDIEFSRLMRRLRSLRYVRLNEMNNTDLYWLGQGSPDLVEVHIESSHITLNDVLKLLLQATKIKRATFHVCLCQTGLFEIDRIEAIRQERNIELTVWAFSERLQNALLQDLRDRGLNWLIVKRIEPTVGL